MAKKRLGALSRKMVDVVLNKEARTFDVSVRVNFKIQELQNSAAIIVPEWVVGGDEDKFSEALADFVGKWICGQKDEKFEDASRRYF